MPPEASRFAGGVAFALFAAIAWLSLADDLPGAVRSLVGGRQLLGHAAMHMALAVAVLMAVPGRRRPAAGMLLSLAVLFELAQGLTRTREVGLIDMAANGAGSVLGIGLVAAALLLSRAR